MILIIIMSFFLEGIFSNIININSIILPLFTITSLVITYPYFNKDKKYLFIIISFIIGIVYDIAYTNSLFINTFTFLICSLIIILINKYIKYNFISNMLTNILVLVLFKFISYILLFIFRFINFNNNILLKGIYSSLILNITYGIFLYYVCFKVNKKLKSRK